MADRCEGTIMQSHTNTFKSRVRHALLGGAWGIGICLATLMVVVATGALRLTPDAGALVILSFMMGIVVGWLAG
jgi:hypothetical protein